MFTVTLKAGHERKEKITAVVLDPDGLAAFDLFDVVRRNRILDSKTQLSLHISYKMRNHATK